MLDGKWYVFDYVSIHNGFNNAPSVIKKPRKNRDKVVSELRSDVVNEGLGVPIEEYCFNKISKMSGGKKPLAFSVYEHDSFFGMDLGRFIPGLKQILDNNGFLFHLCVQPDKNVSPSFVLVKRTGNVLDPNPSHRMDFKDDINKWNLTFLVRTGIMDQLGTADSLINKMYYERTLPEAVYQTYDYFVRWLEDGKE